MKYKICVLTLILLSVKKTWSISITDCEESGNYDEFGKYYISVTLYCGRSPNEFDYGGYGPLYSSNSCYDQIFSNEFVKNMQSLTTGDCRGNRLDQTIFKQFTDLRTYNISNYGIDYLSSSDLNFEKLNKLIASHNELTNISDSLFINTPTITEIDFSHNEITTISSDAFRGANELSEISLSHNKMSSLNDEAFSSLWKLRTLDLSNNSIETFRKHSFKRNMNLKTLNVENNPIQCVDDKIFSLISNLPSLELLVSCENVRNIDARSCGRFFNYFYESIRCSSSSNSQLKCIGSMFVNLKYFNISGNQLQNLELYHFLESSVETLDLSSNTLGQFSKNTFGKLTNLKYLDLSNTHLSSVDFVSSDRLIYQKNYKRLETLRLEQNPFTSINCNFFLFALINEPVMNISWPNIDILDTSCVTSGL